MSARAHPVVIADLNGAKAAAEAITRAGATGERTAVWVGAESDPDLAAFRSEIERALGRDTAE